MRLGDDKNIPSFGICQSEENPVNKSWLAKAGDKIKGFFTGEQEEDDDAEKIILQTEGWTECKKDIRVHPVLLEHGKTYMIQKKFLEIMQTEQVREINCLH